ncbi:expressed unknown protein [Seminavis robusta]|uniref:Uncharacterized protein n=1 Tax=Seminavis robusta TaxID=568900 RepID=A0A9N8HP72_9STRA|nr:expressed unknown protein [Seminavis robusta]|eukprot:Sro1060_g236630.1 n/a (324) ;mRNA; f:6404-7375
MVTPENNKVERRNAALLLSRYRQCLVHHSKDASSQNDYLAWSKPQALEFLRRHRLDPVVPVPDDSVVVKLAEEMIDIIDAAHTLVKLEDKDLASAMFWFLYGKRESPHLEAVSEKLKGRISQIKLKVEPQISSGLLLDALSEWEPPTSTDHHMFNSFTQLMSEWLTCHGALTGECHLNWDVHNTLYQVARVYDHNVLQPYRDRDRVGAIGCKAHYGGQTIYFQALRAWCGDEILSPTGREYFNPFVGVAWCLAGPKDEHHLQFLDSFRSPPVFETIWTETSAAFDVVLALLTENRRALDMEGTLPEYRALGTKWNDVGWNSLS